MSSTATGWAIFQGSGAVASFGRFPEKPNSRLDAIGRIDAAVEYLKSLVTAHQASTPISHVVMELQSHKRTGVSVQGLAVLGIAQGHVRQALKDSIPVFHVDERTWNGSKSKTSRARVIHERCDEYATWAGEELFKQTKRGLAFSGYKRDPGLDVADAIGIGYWTLEQQI